VSARSRSLLILATAAAVLLGGIDGCVFGCHQTFAGGSRAATSAHCHGDAESPAGVAWQATTTCSHQHDASLFEAAPANQIASPLHPSGLAAVHGIADQSPLSPAVTIGEGPPDVHTPTLAPAFTLPLRL
jgi:hypothetical protein